ncbi:MAG: hypothetical protein AB7S38_11190 [Vulcanimicrobiota bacterium]
MNQIVFKWDRNPDNQRETIALHVDGKEKFVGILDQCEAEGCWWTEGDFEKVTHQAGKSAHGGAGKPWAYTPESWDAFVLGLTLAFTEALRVSTKPERKKNR